ncbi:MAG: hypothetical protein ACRDQ2_00305 [Gaiellales bacterium]
MSSVFPHLPRRDMTTFRVALALGVVVVGLLTLLRLFPLALVAAALVVPLLTVVYLLDVDLYEDAPALMLAFTIVWGAATGLGAGLTAREIGRQEGVIAAGLTGRLVLLLGVVLPIASAALMLLGPLILLPNRRFNDVLDGTTFGAASAVSFVGAEILANSAEFLASGVTSNGSAVEWLIRLMTLAVAMPLLAAAAIGAAAGALWLRYCAPVRDRGALGPLGLPVVVVPAAAALLSVAALIQIHLDGLAALALVSGLALMSLLPLRRVIQVGLLEEAGERAIGPEFACPNCGRDTPRHTFCGHCGVSLRALPKAGGRLPHGGRR